MTSENLQCSDSGRRERIRAVNSGATHWNGIDYIETIGGDQIKGLRVALFCDLTSQDPPPPGHSTPPLDLKPCILIKDSSDRRIPVASAVYDRARQAIMISLQEELQPGSYYLKLTPRCGLAYIDQRFDSGDFEVFSNSQLTIDPRSNSECVSEPPIAEPEISYTARDFQSFRRLIADRLALTMPQWQENHVPDIGVAITEIMAYVADHFAQFQDAVATEAYLSTSRSRISARRHARLIDYNVDEGGNARTFLHFDVASDVLITPEEMFFITLPANKPEFSETNLPESALEHVSPSLYRAFEIVRPHHEKSPELALPDITDPLVLVIQLQFMPCPRQNVWYPLVQFLRQKLRPILDAVIPRDGGLGAAWRFAKSLVELSAPQTAMLLHALNDVIREENLRRWISIDQLSARAQEQIASCQDRWDRGRINRIILRDLLPELFTTTEEPDSKIWLLERHDRIEFYTWDQRECCLPIGTTRATLRDGWAQDDLDGACGRPKRVGKPEKRARALKLKKGDFLLLEEVIDPGTGEELDANFRHRQVVRLIDVRPKIDCLNNAPVLDIRWGTEDWLQFPLCISTRMKQPPCKELQAVSVARGNILPIDHGRTINDEPIGFVKARKIPDDCHHRHVSDPQPVPTEKFRPKLSKPGVAFVSTPDISQPASTWLSATQSPEGNGDRLPSVRLLGIPGHPITNKPIFEPKTLRNTDRCGACAACLDEQASLVLQNAVSPALGRYFVDLQRRARDHDGDIVRAWGRILCQRLQLELQWSPRTDLMTSAASDQHFVAEIDDYGLASLRFGNGLGKPPEAGMHFYATYRAGGGEIGNVGADSIVRVVFRQGMHSVIRAIRNPLPAVGGRDPESLNHIKMHAPYAMRKGERAIIAEDYVKLVRDKFQNTVQGVSCKIKVQPNQISQVSVTIDPRGGNAKASLLQRIERELQLYRCAGHIVRVFGPNYVGLEITLDVIIARGHSMSRIRKDLLQQFSDRDLPGRKQGFFHPDRYTFGDRIFKSRVIAEAMKIEGVVSAELKTFRRVGSTGGDASGDTPDVLEFFDYELPVLRNDSTDPSRGVLIINISEADGPEL